MKLHGELPPLVAPLPGSRPIMAPPQVVGQSQHWPRAYYMPPPPPASPVASDDQLRYAYEWQLALVIATSLASPDTQFVQNLDYRLQ